MSEETFLAKVAELARVPIADLTDETPITPQDWDSVDLLDLIAVIDDSFGTTVPLESVNATRTVGELKALVRGSA